MASATAFVQARGHVAEICQRDADARALRLAVLAVIRQVVPFDAYAWVVTDPETSVGSAPLADVPCLPELPRLIRLKYLTPVNRWTRLAGGAASLAAASGGDLAQSLMWRDLLRRYQVTDLASAVQRDRFGCWGFLDLWRTGAAPPFTEKELGFLGGITGPVTAALRRSQALTFTPVSPGQQPPAGPVVLLLSPTLEVRAQTPHTQRYLRVLVPRDEAGQAPVPASAYNVAAQLLAVEAGVDSGPALARAHLAGGRWLTLRAARLDAGGPGERDIAVSIEPASPGARVAVFARASGLSAREMQLLRHLATGGGTRQIAQALFVSEHTIQDHLKSIFTKTGTRSRSALLARALGA